MPNFGPIARLLVQFSPDAMIVVDAHGTIQFANETCGVLFGYSQAELIGRRMDVLVPERFHARHRAHVSSYMKSPSSREMGARFSDLFAVRADGTEFPAGIRLAPFKSGEDNFVAASIRDMTERREINDALVAAREEADRANRAKSRFLATASHDLRQPLQTVRMLNASALKLTEQLPELNDLMLRQEAAIDGVSRMLNALLDISRLESGAIDPVVAPLALDAAFAELKQEFEPCAMAKRLQISFSDPQPVISTDKTLFMQLLQNVIGNAVKYTERGQVRITDSRERDALVISVEDSGIGIPADKLDRIFDEYYQVSRQGTQRLGVGLGLAIVREVARILGYSVSILSTVGQGTQVRIRIPAAALLASTAPQVAASPGNPGRGVTPAAAQTAPPTPAARGRIVLLEDNDAVRTATQMFLNLEGYETQSAASAAEAAAMLSGMLPGDILVADYHLGDNITGLNVLLQLRARQGREVPAVLLSGDLQFMMRVVKTPIPRIRFLSKPVDARALLQAIAELSAA